MARDNSDNRSSGRRRTSRSFDGPSKGGKKKPDGKSRFSKDGDKPRSAGARKTPLRGGGDSSKPFQKRNPFFKDKPFKRGESRDDSGGDTKRRFGSGNSSGRSSDRRSNFSNREERPKRFSDDKKSYGDKRFSKSDGSARPRRGKPPGEGNSFSGGDERPRRFSDDKKSYGEKRFSKSEGSARPRREKPPEGGGSYSNRDERPRRYSDDKKSYGEKKRFSKSDDQGTSSSRPRRGKPPEAGSNFQGRDERPRRTTGGDRFTRSDKKSERGGKEESGFRAGNRRKDEDAIEKKGFFTKKTGTSPRHRKSFEEVPATESTGTEKIRLNRFIANSGVCSRREADELISMGLISVNGTTITELGYKVNRSDEVRYEDRVLRAEKPVYILMNKPKGYLTTTDDPQERNTVMQIIGGAVKERIYPVGRLDRNTTGLLLLTNDGELAEKLMHPSYNVKKIYKVELDKPFTREDMQAVIDGVRLEEGKAMVDDIAIISDDGKTVGLEIHIGWNRVVRRIFESLQYDVVKLDRSVYAGLDKKDLARGHWRFLTKEEVVHLKHFKK